MRCKIFPAIILPPCPQSLPLGSPDERLKLRVSVDPKFRESIRLSGGLTNTSQLTPPAKVPSSPTCSSPERGGEQENSLYEAGMYGKQFRAGVVEWGGAQYGEQTGYQPPARHQDRFSYSAPFNQVRSIRL